MEHFLWEGTYVRVKEYISIWLLGGNRKTIQKEAREGGKKRGIQKIQVWDRRLSHIPISNYKLTKSPIKRKRLWRVFLSVLKLLRDIINIQKCKRMETKRLGKYIM